MNAVHAGARLAWSRARGPSLPLLLLASSIVALSLVRLTRSAGPLAGLDDLLEGPVLGLTLPLVSYLIMQRVADNRRLDESVQPLARHGADRRLIALGLLLVAAALSALSGGLLAAVTVSAAHTRLDAPWLLDVSLSTGIALAAGIVYSAWFWAASTLGRRGGGRGWALACDLLFGAGSSWLALPFPRSHLRNLLGGMPAVELSQHGAWLMFLLLLACSAVMAWRRLRA